MNVIKRSGTKEAVSFDKITARIKKLCYGLDENFVDHVTVAQKVIQGLYDGVTTVELDNLAAETAASMSTVHPDYAQLAARIAISNLHKETDKSFSATMEGLFNYLDPKTGAPAGLIGDDTMAVIRANRARLDAAIIYDRDFEFDYFGYKTLERSYLMRMDGAVVERPQHMLMRVAVGIHQDDIESAIQTYQLMSEKWFIHATPTLFNSGTPKPQMSSCFAAGTQVYTVNAGPKNIEEVKIGDLVITHKGNVKPVVQLHRNALNGRQMYRVKAFGTPSLKVTGNHKFWSISGEQRDWEEGAQFNAIEYLRVGDYIAIPNKTDRYDRPTIDLAEDLPTEYGNILLEYTNDERSIQPVSVYERGSTLNVTDDKVLIRRKHTPVKRQLLINEDFAELMGIWLGDGHLMMGRNAAKTHQFVRGLGFAVYHEAYEMIDKIVSLCQTVFGITPSVSERNSTNTVNIHLSSHVVGAWVESRFGRGFAGKRLWNEMFSWDQPMVIAFLQGLVSSDGCVTKSGDVRITMANVSLVKSIFAMARNLGVELTYSEAKTLKRGATKRTARINLPKQTVDLTKIAKLYRDDRLERMKRKEAHQSRSIQIDGVSFVRLMQKEKIADSPEFVYTLGVKDDHSYNVEGLIAENCFLLSMTDDSISGIFETLNRCAKISQSAGGIGLSIHNIRATGSYIKGTGGTSNGIVPMLKVFNDTARYVDQGGGKRKGAFAIYLEPWHADIFDFLDLKKNHGKEEMRARDLFYALWMNDLFMQRVKEDGEWSLFDPNEAPGLFDAYGGEFEALYHQYEAEGKARKTVKAQELWFAILDSQIETGTPYILYKDAANKKSNQQNLGTIRSSNLCCIAADQRVVTDRGMITIGELYERGGKNQVVGRKQIRTASEMFLPRPNGEMVKIHTREGYTHKVTPDHKVWVENVGWKEAQHLIPGDRLTIQQYEGLFGYQDLPDEAFIAGLIAGDGTFSEKTVHVDVWDNAERQLPMIEGAIQRVVDHYEEELDYDNLTGNEHAATFKPARRPTFTRCNTADNSTKYRLTSSILKTVLEVHGFTRRTKHQVPDFVWKGSRKTVAAYLRGLYLADATVQAGDVTTCSLASIHREFLEDIQIIWANFGVKTSLTKMRDEKPQLLPDGKGGQKLYVSKPLYRLHITSIRGCKIAEEITGIGTYRNNETFLENIEKRGYRQKLWATFDRIEHLPNEDAYCLLVDSEEHSWTVNGLITKNTEILEYTSPDEVAVCNLASLALPKYVTGEQTYDFQRLFDVTRVVTRNLNKVIDRNYYPIEEARNSNMRHRPIGLGVQGLADAFLLMRMPFDSPEAKQLNKDIFETIYFAACTESIALAKQEGHYESYPGSPTSKGQLQFDLWGVEPSDRWDWAGLKAELAEHGMRNSLLVAPMPTASTSQILGNNECFEPYSSNMYTRRTLSGEFIVVNKHLLHDLIGLGLWDNAMRNRLMASNGSIQDFDDVPQHLRDLYKTVWEISQKVVIDMAADRGAFVCQSQSMNLFVENVNFGKLSSMHFYAWQKGLKTGMYYLRTKAARDAIQFTVDKTLTKQGEEGDGQVKQGARTQVQSSQKEAAPAATDTVSVPEVATAPAPRPTAGVAGFEELSAKDVETVGKSCSLDDPDCIACSA